MLNRSLLLLVFIISFHFSLLRRFCIYIQQDEATTPICWGYLSSPINGCWLILKAVAQLVGEFDFLFLYRRGWGITIIAALLFEITLTSHCFQILFTLVPLFIASSSFFLLKWITSSFQLLTYLQCHSFQFFFYFKTHCFNFTLRF